MRLALAFLILLGLRAHALGLEQDCRRPGSIGTAMMAADGTITLNLVSPTARLALAYHPGDPHYARILSHIGGLQPGQKKPVPPFC